MSVAWSFVSVDWPESATDAPDAARRLVEWNEGEEEGKKSDHGRWP